MAANAVASEPLLKVHDYEGLKDADIKQLIQRPRIDFSSIIETVRPLRVSSVVIFFIASCPAAQPLHKGPAGSWLAEPVPTNEPYTATA